MLSAHSFGRDVVEGLAEVVGQGVGGGDGVLAGLDLDGAVTAGGGDELPDGPVDTAPTGLPRSRGAGAASTKSRQFNTAFLPTTCHAGRWSRIIGVVVTEGYDARGICRRVVLRTGLAAVAAVASGCTDIPMTRPGPPGMRITGNDGFSGPYAVGTYTIARGGPMGRRKSEIAAAIRMRRETRAVRPLSARRCVLPRLSR